MIGDIRVPHDWGIEGDFSADNDTSESCIYVNGKLVESNHFGYKSFSVDITELAKFDEDNLIVVYAEVKSDCDRWTSWRLCNL